MLSLQFEHKKKYQYINNYIKERFDNSNATVRIHSIIILQVKY